MPGRGVGPGVGQQVGQHLVQPGAVAGDRHRLLGQVQPPAVVGPGDPGVGHRVDDQHGQVDLVGGQRAPGVQPGQQQQVVDQGGHPRGLGLDPAQRVRDGLGVVLVAAGQFGVAADGGQRGAQFVRGVGDELADPGLDWPGGLRARPETWPSIWFSAAPTCPTSVRVSVSWSGTRTPRSTSPRSSGSVETCRAVAATRSSGRSDRRTIKRRERAGRAEAHAGTIARMIASWNSRASCDRRHRTAR